MLRGSARLAALNILGLTSAADDDQIRAAYNEVNEKW